MVNNGTKVEKWNQNDLKVGQNRPKIGSRLKMDSKSSGNQLEINSKSTKNCIETDSIYNEKYEKDIIIMI